MVRFLHWGELGKDFSTYRDAIRTFFEGGNPYAKTSDSFSDIDDDSGFAYLPGILYVYYPFYYLHNKFQIPFEYLYQIPILLADLGIGLLLIKKFGGDNKLACIFALLFWYLNPYFILKRNYFYLDPITIFFMFLAFDYLGNYNFESGLFYAISVSLKTFPIILFPLFFIRSKNKITFTFFFALTLLLLGAPFLNDIQQYIQSTLLVYGDRYVQGKPFLFLISYLYNLEFIKLIPFKFYALASVASGWAYILINQYYAKRKRGCGLHYLPALIPFGLFYLFTPVLNKTYLLWGIPFLLLASYEAFNKKKVFFYLTTIMFYSFYLWYLYNWNYGLHVDYKYY